MSLLALLSQFSGLAVSNRGGERREGKKGGGDVTRQQGSLFTYFSPFLTTLCQVPQEGRRSILKGKGGGRKGKEGAPPA